MDAKLVKELREKSGAGMMAVSYTHLDVYKRQLVAVSGMGIGAVNGALSMLELDDRVKVEYGKVYICLLYTSFW